MKPSKFEILELPNFYRFYQAKKDRQKGTQILYLFASEVVTIFL